jgi:hypothetical protein
VAVDFDSFFQSCQDTAGTEITKKFTKYKKLEKYKKFVTVHKIQKIEGTGLERLTG